MTRVKLAIRIRPFTEKELKSEKDRTAIINVSDEHTITITNIKVNLSGAGDSRERVRPYYADYIFNNIQYQNTNITPQEKVYNTIGQEVLTNISQGMSVCVLAYGQSATGKTYTMMGTESKPGLIPRLCRALGDEEPLDVKVSFLEIYNEKVHDLLVGEVVPEPNTFSSLPRRKGNARKDLRVREHPSKGPYVQNLRRVHVHDVGTLLSVVSEGARRRSTAATRRNPASSRSHALLELSTPRATLHLTDLAGSEKASWEGCGRGRLKEGANINKSLVALSNVISALVNRGSVRSRFVPYRNSALTWLLKDCFTGGGNIFIIATVSPSVACYGESASTLRWASQARCLQTPKTTITTGTISKTVLQAQLNQLLSELSRHHIRYIIETGKISYDDEHWSLGAKSLGAGDPQPATKIGNIMNTTYLKSDTHNSESINSSAASVSSDIANTFDKCNIVGREINKEVDKLIAPTLERTRSGSALEITAPLRNKKRQYFSQEVLSNELFSHSEHRDQISDINDSPNNNEQIIACKDSHVPILYDNQRAEIIASVTERLYSKFRKDAASNKTESIVEKKIVQPLNELKICTNARQRLIELSQKAIRNKRRIGIPAHTQTMKVVVRVKDQEIDIQSDLAAYSLHKNCRNTLYKDVATETIPITPRYKEVAVGDGCLSFFDKYTTMELTKDIKIHSAMMTDVILKNNIATQTNILLPKRKKCASLCTKASKKINDKKFIKNLKNSNTTSVININISPVYSFDSDTSSCSDSAKNGNMKRNNENLDTSSDLPAYHNNSDSLSAMNQSISDATYKEKNTRNDKNKPEILEHNIKTEEDFPDDEEYPLPRVTVDTKKAVDQDDIKNMILGRNMNSYPYNIILSPNKSKESKTIIKFKESESKFTKKCHVSSNNKTKEDECINTADTFSDSSGSSKQGTDLFVWNAGTTRSFNKKPQQTEHKNPSLMYKNKPACGSQNSSYYENCFIEETDTDLNIDTDSITEQACHAKNIDKYWMKKTTNRCGLEECLNVTTDKHANRNKGNSFENTECNIIKSCKGLENTVSTYEGYLDKYYENKEYTTRSPTEYLQYLVNLRREVVKESIGTHSIETISSD